MSAFLDDLIRLSGLSPIFAKTVIRRALIRAGVDPTAAQKVDLDRALPEIERAISVYLGEEAAGRHVRAMKTAVADR